MLKYYNNMAGKDAQFTTYTIFLLIITLKCSILYSLSHFCSFCSSLLLLLLLFKVQ